MSNGKNHGRLRNGSCFVTGSVWACIFLIMGNGGCARFNEYVAPPTIVDASTHAKSGQPTYQPISKEQALALSQPERLNPISNATPTPPEKPYARPVQSEPVPTIDYVPPPSYAARQGTVQPAVVASAPMSAAAVPQAPIRDPGTTYQATRTPPNYVQEDQYHVSENYSQMPQSNTRPAVPSANPLRPVTGQPVVSNVTAVAANTSRQTNPFANYDAKRPTQTDMQHRDVIGQTTPTTAPNSYAVRSNTADTGSLPPLYAEKPAGSQQLDSPLKPVDSPALNQRPAPPNQMRHEPALQPAVAETDTMGGKIDPVYATMNQLESTLQKHPDNRQTQLALRFLYLAYGMEDKALGLIPSLPSTQQTDVISLMKTISLLTQAEKAGSERNSFHANQALEALQEWKEKLSDQADFKISRLVICNAGSVKGFGQYQPIARSKLQSRQPLQTQVYCELSNFKSIQQDDGRFKSNVAVEIALYDVNNNYNAIVKRPRTEIPDMSLNLRHDFFFYGPMQIPSLAPGEYELVVKVEDLIGNKTAVPARHKFTVQGSSNPY